MRFSQILAAPILVTLLLTSTCQASEDIKLDGSIKDEPTSYFEEDSLMSMFKNRISFDDYVAYSLRAMALVAGFDNDLHRYDRKNDLINSFARNLSYSDNLKGLTARVHPSEISLLSEESELTLINNDRNQELCEVQLHYLLDDAKILFEDSRTFSSSSQLDIINYLDSFGTPSAQLMGGNAMWLGSYEQCLNAKLSHQDPMLNFATKYCIANFHSPKWPRKQPGVSAVKLGICLPENCNSISFLRFRKLIQQLVRVSRLNQVPYSDYELTGLYCLPDEQSPLRQFSNSAKLFILFLSSWMTIVLYFSIKYEIQRILHYHGAQNQQKPKPIEETKCMKIFALRISLRKLFEQTKSVSMKANEKRSDSITQLSNEDRQHQLQLNTDIGLDSVSSSLDSESMSLNDQQTDNFAPCNVLKQTHIESLDCNKLDLLRKAALVNLSINQAVGNQRQVTINKDNNNNKSIIDLSVVDGVKVVSMIWLISAHTMLYFIRTISNGREFWTILRDARFMTVMAGIFPVDTFFTVTGILTAYLKFNKNNGQAMNKASYWFEAFVHRYLRFMPMYIIVFWFTRDVSEYMGGGPLWDYATANTSLRSVCKDESISVPLLFQANFKPIDQHCVKPAWYLANDYQYLLLTPLFMTLIMKSTRIGYLVIGASVALSLILQFLTVFLSTDMEDFGALINFKPMFATYVLKNLWKLYVLPYNRIPPYLIGILTGHLMYVRAKALSDKHSTQIKMAKLSQGDLNSLASTSSTPETRNSTSDILENTSTHSSQKSAQNSRLLFNNSLSKTIGGYVNIRVWKPLILLISIIYLPMVTRIVTQDGLSAKVGTSLIIAMMRFTWSLAIARLIFICATRSLEQNHHLSDGNDSSFVIAFLTSPKWKPWSKIGLSALLIQWEIIGYLAQSQTSAPQMTITFLLAIILLCIVATYIFALLIYLTLEYPLSQIEQLYIHPLLFSK